MRASWISIAVLVALLIAFRCLGAAFSDELPNFSPLPALFLCCLACFRGSKAWLVPLGAWILTDPIVSLLQGYPVLGWHHLGVAVGLAAAAGLGFALRGKYSTAGLLGGSLLAAVAFYFLTNTLAFTVSPLYPKTLEGFLQAQWTGPAGYGPTWIFLRNLAGANLLFTGLFLLARAGLPEPAAPPAVAAR